jgi:probable phosphomutase (TIGR03848 family)
MAVLFLIRHAVTASTGSRLTGQALGVHLSDDGRAQAEALADRVRGVPFAALYSSPLERCLETAGAVAAGRRIEVVQEPGVIEVGYGRWTGRPLAQLARTNLWKRVQRTPGSVRFPDGETLAEVQRRTVHALDAIATRHPRKVVGVVAHADVIRLAVAHYAGVHIDLFQRLIVSPASVSVVAVGDGVPRILRLNDTGAFGDFRPPRPPRHRRDAVPGAPARRTASRRAVRG